MSALRRKSSVLRAPSRDAPFGIKNRPESISISIYIVNGEVQVTVEYLLKIKFSGRSREMERHVHTQQPPSYGVLKTEINRQNKNEIKYEIEHTKPI